MANSADPDQLASSEANWSGATLFAKTGHVLFSKRRVILLRPTLDGQTILLNQAYLRSTIIQLKQITLKQGYWSKQKCMIIILSRKFKFMDNIAVQTLTPLAAVWSGSTWFACMCYCCPNRVNVLKFRTPKCLTKWHMQTVQTQIRLLLEGAVWSGSTLFATALF